jgi:hypothetical protein
MKDTNFLNYILAASAVILTFSVLWTNITINLKASQQGPQAPHVSQTVDSIQNPQYPMNMEVTSHISGVDLDETVIDKLNSDKLISIVNKVSYNSETKKYIYDYEITYNGKKNVFLLWEVLDQIIRGEKISNSNALHLVELTPNKNQKFKMESESPPALYEGFAWLYIKKEGEIWEMKNLSAQPAPLPIKSSN